MFLLIAIAVWACALVIWWICSNAFRHSDLDKLKSRLIVLVNNQVRLIEVDIRARMLVVPVELLQFQLLDRFLQCREVVRQAAVAPGHRDHSSDIRIGQRLAKHLRRHTLGSQ